MICGRVLRRRANNKPGLVSDGLAPPRLEPFVVCADGSLFALVFGEGWHRMGLLKQLQRFFEFRVAHVVSLIKSPGGIGSSDYVDYLACEAGQHWRFRCRNFLVLWRPQRCS